MNKPHELLLYLFQVTNGGSSWVNQTDLPACLDYVYGDPTGQDEGALLACNFDMLALVKLGDVVKLERAGDAIFCLTSAGKAKAQILGTLDALDTVPVGPL